MVLLSVHQCSHSETKSFLGSSTCHGAGVSVISLNGEVWSILTREIFKADASGFCGGNATD